MSGPLDPPGYLQNLSRTTGDMRSALELINSVIKELIGGSAEAPVQTISSSQITPPNNACVIPVDIAGGGTLNTINNVNLRDGQVIFLHSVAPSNPVTIVNGASGASPNVPIATFTGENIILTNPAQLVSLKYNQEANVMQEISRLLIGVLQEP